LGLGLEIPALPRVTMGCTGVEEACGAAGEDGCGWDPGDVTVGVGKAGGSRMACCDGVAAGWAMSRRPSCSYSSAIGVEATSIIVAERLATVGTG
jgi:hypothetical protein